MQKRTNHDHKIRKRVQLVHIAANELGLIDPQRKHATDTDDEYRLILRRWNRPGTRQPVTSSLQMSYQQLGELLEFFSGLGFRVKRMRNEKPQAEGRKKYESSIKGLREEICDLARARWGASWELPLNNFCRRFGIQRWQWLDVSHGRAVMAALRRMQEADGKAPVSPGGVEPEVAR